MNTNNISNLKLLLPITLGAISANLFPIKKAGENIPFRPDPYVFRIVWPILYILIGYSWLLNNNNNNIDILFLILNISLNSWLYFYNKYKNSGIYIIYINILILLLLMISLGNKSNINSVYLLVPLLVWLMLAKQLNITEVILDKN